MKESITQYGPSRNSQHIAELLDHIFAQGKNVDRKIFFPLCIWGTHGIGKTQMVKEYALSKDWGFSYIAPAQFEEMGDLHGMPKEINKDGKMVTVYSPPDWVPTTEGPGILLIDDFNRADERILKGCMQLFQNYELSSWKLPQKWEIVATANPDLSDYSVTSLDDAMLTRMIHVTYEFDHKIWAKWAVKSGVDERGVAFVLTYPELINNSRTTPRSLTQFFELITNLTDLKNDLALVLTLANTVLDEVTSNAFVSFINNDLDELINPEEILNSQNFSSVIKRIEDLSFDVKKGERVDKIAVITTRLYLHLTSSAYRPTERHAENLIKFLLSVQIPNDLSMGLYMDLQKSKDKEIQLMLRDKRLAMFLIDAM
jgi:hypothetical protein